MRRVFVFVMAAGTLGLAALTAGCPASTSTPATAGKGPTEQDRAAMYQKGYAQQKSGGAPGRMGAPGTPPGPGGSR